MIRVWDSPKLCHTTPPPADLGIAASETEKAKNCTVALNHNKWYETRVRDIRVNNPVSKIKNPNSNKDKVEDD